ncbi:aminopeptidase P family protein [Bosea caraganae]|uniref:Aminopeptidase P family protein n=1 Tax=Bosea caraganae TaxID=2763117 RepID=A0A370KY53_9HYPH|nr:Xaa-Pro peptidase family protein [Bosea caraganae]RDJ19898.1 aminopeptidase P family protein [Bosea caraganae]RDJ23836.1 aminopeptidase P family protein [Bosea caraganae]
MLASPTAAPPPVPSDADYRNRLKRTQVEMKKRGFDILALAGADILRFLTGLHGLPVTRPIWLIVPQNGNPGFVSPGSEVKEIQARSGTPVIARWVEWEEPVPAPTTHQDALAGYVAESAPQARTIGIDFNGTNGANIELVRQALGQERVRDAGLLLRDLLAIKDAAALDVIRLSCDVIGHQFRASVDAVAPGIAEWEVSLASFVAGTRRAAELWNGNEEQSPLALGLHMTGSGAERTARCHAAGAGRRMREGDVVQICRCSTGFFGHLIGYDRPVQVGSTRPSAEMRKVIDLARESQEAALAATRPGATADAVHAAAMAVIDRGGWENPVLHRTGRSIGYSSWDGHEIKAGSQTVLEPGMVITIEPGIYVDGVGGARFGDTVLVTEAGHEVLTPFDLGRDI